MTEGEKEVGEPNPLHIIKENHFLFDQQTIETCWLFLDTKTLLINLHLAVLL